MNLPEYKDDKPLYSSGGSDWDDIKFPIMLVALPLLLIVGIGGIFFGLFDIIISLLRAIFH